MARANLDGLDPGARRDLLILLAKAKDAGLAVTVTSGKRTREEQAALYANRHKNPYPVAPPGSSRHETGLAVDISVSKKDRAKFNELAQSHGWKWHGPSDAVHYEYGGPHTKKPSLLPGGDVGAALAAFPAKPKAKARPRNDVAEALSVFPSRPKAKPKDDVAEALAAFSTPKPSRGKAATGALMGELLQGKQPPAPTRGRMSLDQAAAVASGMPGGVDPRSAAAGVQFLKEGAARVGKEIGRPVAAITAGFNEMERRAQLARARGERTTVGPVDLDIAGALSDIAGGVRAGVRAFKSGEQPEATFVRDALGMLEPAEAGQPRVPKPGQNPTLYGLVTAGEQLAPFAYDPLNVVAGPASKLAGKGAAAVGKGVAKRSPKLGAAQKAAELGRTLETGVIQPTLRHKEEVQGVIREANVNYGNVRKASVKAGKPDPAAGGGINPIWKLAEDAVRSNTGRYPGKLTLSAADANRLSGAAKAAKLDPATVQKTADRLVGIADEVFATQPKGMTRADFNDAFFAIDPKSGELAGLRMARESRRRALLKGLAPSASNKPGPGLAQVPSTMRKTSTGAMIPEYGELAGKYLPKATVTRLKSVIKEGDEPILWHKIVRGAKSSYLAQPFTPVKSLVQNAGGVEIALNKEGGSILDAIPHAGSAGKELWEFWTTGKLSPMLKEFSDVDPEFLRTLSSVKIADGTAGKMVRIGGKVVQLPAGKEGAKQVAAALVPGSPEHVFIKANGWGDQFGKLVLYKTLRARGVSAQDAVKSVRGHLISFNSLPSDVGDLVAKVDRNGFITFANVPAQLAQQAAKTAVTRPDLLYRPGQLQERLLEAFGAEERYERDVPEEKRSPFVVPNPVSPEKFVDYSALAPLSEPMKMLAAITGAAESGKTPGEVGMDVLQSVLFDRSVFAPFLRPWHPDRPLTAPGAPPDKPAEEFVQNLRDTYNPLGRAAGQFASVDAGRGTSKDPYAAPESVGEWLGNRLGARTVKTGTRAEQKEAGKERVIERLREVRPVWAEAWKAARAAGLEGNPYAQRVSKMSLEEVAFTVRAAMKETMKYGQRPDWTPEEIKRRALWLAALEARGKQAQAEAVARKRQ